jgi:uncharacterized phiE125 gp8 family phage protein
MIIYAGQLINGWKFTTHKPGSTVDSAPAATPTVTEWVNGAVVKTATVTLVSTANYKAVITTPTTLAYGDTYLLVATYTVNEQPITDDLINDMCSSTAGGESAISTDEPVTVADVKLRLRIAHATDDVMLADMITTARLKVEELCSCSCLTATKTRVLDAFPTATTDNPYCIIYPPIRPLIAVTGITYYDTANALQTFSDALYQVDTTQKPGRIRPVYGQYWPYTYYNRLGAVTITYTAGYGATSATVPHMLRQGIYYFVADLYRNRENYAIGVSGVHEVPHTAMHYLADFLDRRIA